MTDPIRQELAESLHAATLGEAIACDYHQRPKELKPMSSGVKAMWLVDYPQLQLDQWLEGWTLDATRCADHVVDEIVAPTRASMRR